MPLPPIIPTPEPVLSMDPGRRLNSTAIDDCRRLGYLLPDDAVLDLTYGKGAFWSTHRPPGLVTNDIDPACKADLCHDLRAMPFDDRSFDVVVSDVPYKLNGRSTGTGPSAADARYGVSGPYRSAADKHELLVASTVEGARLTRRLVMVKCQDSQSSGRYNPQTFIAWQAATESGLVLVDQLHVVGMRKQPPDVRQVSARHNYSTLMIFRRKGRQ